MVKKPRPIDAQLVVIFREGLRMLMAQGTTEDQARNFLGKLVQQHGKVKVAAAVERAREAAPVHLRSWLMRACREDVVKPGAFTFELEGGRTITVASDTRIVWDEPGGGRINGYQTPDGKLHLLAGRARRKR